MSLILQNIGLPPLCGVSGNNISFAVLCEIIACIVR